MTTGAHIVKELLAMGGSALVESVYERAGVTERVGDALTGKLCGEGVLERVRDRLKVKNKERASLIAESVPVHGSNGGAKTSGVMSPPIPTPAVRKPFIIPPSVKVREGVPLPEARFGSPLRPYMFDYESMKCGSSFIVAIPDGWTPSEVSQRLSADAQRFAKKNPDYHFAVRVTKEDGDVVVGVWRNDKGKPRGTPARTPKSQAAHDRKTH